MKVGKAKYESGKKTFKIEGDKSLAAGVFRILPALGSLADAGRYFMKYEVEWGYKDSDNINRPFLNCRKLDFENPTEDENGKKIYPVLVESAAHLKRQEVKANKDAVIAAFKKGEATQDQVKDADTLTRRYNLDVKFYHNVVNLNNEIGLLKLNNSFHKALKSAIKKYKEENDGQDPLDILGGVYFSFRRTNETGKLQDYVFEVTPYTENVQATVNGQTQTLQQVKKHDMDQAFINRLDGEAFDLGDMYPALDADQTAEVVNGGAPAVDRILGKAKGGNKKTTTTTTTTTAQASTVTAQSTNTVTEAPVEKSVETVAETPVTTETVNTQTGEITETPAAQSTPVSNENANDDFLASLGIE